MKIFIFFASLFTIFTIVLSDDDLWDAFGSLNQVESEAKYEMHKVVEIIPKLIDVINGPVQHLSKIPKVNEVFHDFGLCLSNGVMELINHFVPAPFVPILREPLCERLNNLSLKPEYCEQH